MEREPAEIKSMSKKKSIKPLIREWRDLSDEQKAATVDGFTQKELLDFIAARLVVMYAGIPKTSFKFRKQSLDLFDKIKPLFANDFDRTEAIEHVREAFKGAVEYHNDLARVGDWPEGFESI